MHLNDLLYNLGIRSEVQLYMILHFHLLDIYVPIHDEKQKQEPTIASKLEKQLAL